MRAQLMALALGAWLLPAAVLAQAPAEATPSPTPTAATQLSLAQAVALALEKSPMLQAVRTEVPAAEARLAQARAGGRLVASTTTSLVTGSMAANLPGAEGVDPFNYLPVPPTGLLDQNLMVMYPLFTGGRVGAEVASASAEVQAAQAEVDAALLELAYQVREGYWRVLLDQTLLAIQEQNVAEQEERLRVDQAAYDAGKIPLYYVLRDKAELADAQQGLTNARRDAQADLLRLQQTIGLDLAVPVTLTDAGEVSGAAAPAPAAELVAQAAVDRPEARAAAARLEAARRQVAARRSSFRPQVAATLMGDVSRMDSEDLRGDYSVGLVASLPLLDGGRRQAEVAEAEAMVRKAEADQATLELEIARQVRTALLDLEAADHNVATAQAAETAAEEDYRVALVRYQAGKAINLEPISALTALVRAHTNLAQARFDQRVAQDAVERAVGRLPQVQ